LGKKTGQGGKKKVDRTRKQVLRRLNGGSIGGKAARSSEKEPKRGVTPWPHAESNHFQPQHPESTPPKRKQGGRLPGKNSQRSESKRTEFIDEGQHRKKRGSEQIRGKRGSMGKKEPPGAVGPDRG